jgi:hypothetical protein
MALNTFCEEERVENKLAGFVVNFNGIGCNVIEDIGNLTDCSLDERDRDYAIWDFRNNKVIGLFTLFGVVSDGMEAFVIYGLKPLQTAEEYRHREILNRKFLI